MSASKKVLVLGANGFIGSHLVDSLVGLGFDVVAFDRFSVEPHFNDSEKIHSIKGDISNLSEVEAALKDVPFVIHAFSATTPYSADLNPYIDIDQNLLLSAKLFELCAKQEVKKIVYISSGGAIYGSSAENGKRAKETDVALPISPYGICKLATERYLEYFERKYGVEHVSYRLSNPYGPRQVTKHNQGVMPRFISNISNRKPITLYGDGSSERDYIYIENAANFIAQTFEQCQHRVYNLGSGKQTSLTTVIDILEGLLEVKADVEKLPEPHSFVHTARLDISRFSEEFGLVADVDLKTGLAKTIEYLEATKDA